MIHCPSRFSTVCLPCRQLGPPNFVVASTARRPNGNPNVKCAHGPANQERRWHFCSLPCLSIVWLSHQSPLVSFRFSTYCIKHLLYEPKMAVTTAPWTEMAGCYNCSMDGNGCYNCSTVFGVLAHVPEGRRPISFRYAKNN